MRAGIGLGSNIDPRMDYLQRTWDEIRTYHTGRAPAVCSRVYETSPVDCAPGTNAFLNATIEISIDIPPEAFLRILKGMERELGRPALHGVNSPRTIDLDLLYCDDLVLSDGDLLLPHPRITGRRFVLEPLNDICPGRVLPGTPHPIRELLRLLKTDEILTVFGNFR